MKKFNEMPVPSNYGLFFRTFPHCPVAFPMELFNEEWAQKNHGQSLQRLAERGGLSVCEMMANIYRRPYQQMDARKAIEQLCILKDQHLSSQKKELAPVTSKQIIEAWARIRKADSTTPDEVLDLMKEAALEKIGVSKPEPNKPMPYFEIIEALCRCALANQPTNAVTHQINRLHSALLKDGFQKEADFIDQMLHPEPQEMKNFKLVRSDWASAIPEAARQQLIEYIYEFAWHYGTLYHIGEAEKIKEAIQEKFNCPKRFLQPA
jgi:hypothetical protein